MGILLGERLVCSLAGYLLFTAAILSTNVELLFLLSLGDIGETGIGIGKKK